MSRYAIRVAYKGSAYAGWQIQPDARTVQGELYQAIRTILTDEIILTGAGRTDAGVHAEGQIAHFDFDGPIDSVRFLRSLYGLLPRDIAVTGIQEVPDTFHARFSAVSRTYRFRIITQPDPLLADQSWFIPHNLDTGLMKQCWHILPGEHDFSNFCRRDPMMPHYRCVITEAAFEENETGFLLGITANRFLRSMVRMLVGAVVKTGRGKFEPEWFEEALHNPANEKSGFTAPASGLVLESVTYEQGVLEPW
ncbi:MAG: tRNA pseudouridine(38-40) synthase TruA [Balneolaceae bacterium]|nr:MAG: tRNA pseudouridine(38-40) synthase TruA [Balneolaceae bacterium]